MKINRAIKRNADLVENTPLFPSDISVAINEDVQEHASSAPVHGFEVNTLYQNTPTPDELIEENQIQRHINKAASMVFSKKITHLSTIEDTETSKSNKVLLITLLHRLICCYQFHVVRWNIIIHQIFVFRIKSREQKYHPQIY